MEETIFPPSPNWFSPNVINSREDGSVSYGSKNNIVLLIRKRIPNDNYELKLHNIHNAHTQRITSVAFSPSNCSMSLQNTVASCSDDGFVKLWKIDTMSALMAHKSHWQEQVEFGKVVCLDWSYANPHHIISVAENNSVVVWNVLTNTTVKFLFQKLGATVVACCPFNEKIVAVGGKAGQIFILNLSGSGSVMFKLRGHDNKINTLTWCPVPYNVFNENDICEEFLLASACQDKEIFVWRGGSDGKCEVKFQVPTSSLSKKDGGQYYGKLGNSFSYTALLWADPYKIYFSSNFGELLYFDIKAFVVGNLLNTNSEKKRNKQSCFIKLCHCFHLKGLFAIAGSPKNFILYDNGIELKSKLKFKIESNNCKLVKSSNPNYETETNFKWKVITTSTSSLLWTAGQDKKLVGCVTSSGQVEIVYNFHTVNGFVYCAVISPQDPNKIAIGVGDGMIRLWNLTEKSGEIQTFWQKIKDRVMALAWHPSKDGLLAYGTSEGRVGLVDSNTNKLPNVFKPNHSLPIYNLSWGPPFPLEDNKNSSSKSEFHLYAVGNSTLTVYSPSKISGDPVNLSRIIPFPCKKQTDVSWKPDYSVMAVGNEDGSICFVEPSNFKILYTFMPYKKMIYSIAWHPLSTPLESGLSPYHGYFTSGSTDNRNEVRVFNYTKEENNVEVVQVATLKGHHGYIQSVSWCPHLSGRLISNSGDGSVQIWDVFSQCPQVNFTPNEMPLFSLWSPVDSDIVFTGCKNDLLCVWRISKQSKVAPSSNTKVKKQKKDKNSIMIAENKANHESNEVEEKKKNDVALGNVAFAEPQNVPKNEKEFKMFSKAWKADANENVKNCYLMLKEEKIENNQANYSLPFLCDEERLKELIKNEEESCKRANKTVEYYELSLWSGNIKDVLEERIKKGQLDDFLVSLAPMISPRTWQEACLSYSKTLAEKKLFRKAASYMIVCHKIYEAIELLVNADLYLEALCIARSRLPETDPLIKEIIFQYASWLFKNGASLKACECYIYLGEYLEVAKICGKKNQPEYLGLAALAARKCGAANLESIEAMNAILKCFESENFELARRVCEDHYNLKHLSLIYNMYHTVYQLDAEKLVLEKDIFSYIKDISDLNDIDFPPTSHQLYHKYMFYKNKRQVLIIVAQELSFAICARDAQNIVTHLIKALSTCCRYINSVEGEIHPLYKLCTWLSSDDFLSENSYFTLSDNHLLPKVKSLRAYLCSALARYLNGNCIEENIVKYLNVLSQVTDDLLDKDSYKYFKNLIEIEICEKRLITNRDKVVRDKLTNASNKNIDNCNSCNNLITNDAVESGKMDESGSIEILHSGSLPLELNHLNVIGNRVENLKDSEVEVAKDESLNGEYENVYENIESQDLKEGLEEKITQDTELLSKLKTETENFESSRISFPNPIPVYFMLKNVLESVSENKVAKVLLESIENKWKELN